MRGFAQLRKQSEKMKKKNLLERFTVFFAGLSMPG